MNEQQIEALDSVFPKGYLCVCIMPNERIHVAYKNLDRYIRLTEVEDIVSEFIENCEEEQDESHV